MCTEITEMSISGFSRRIWAILLTRKLRGTISCEKHYLIEFFGFHDQLGKNKQTKTHCSVHSSAIFNTTHVRGGMMSFTSQQAHLWLPTTVTPMLWLPNFKFPLALSVLFLLLLCNNNTNKVVTKLLTDKKLKPLTTQYGDFSHGE